MGSAYTVSLHSAPIRGLLAWALIFALGRTRPSHTGMENKRAVLSMSNLGVRSCEPTYSLLALE